MPDRQMSLAEALLDPRMGLHGRLKAFSEIIDWAPLGELAGRVRSSPMGRKPLTGWRC